MNSKHKAKIKAFSFLILFFAVFWSFAKTTSSSYSLLNREYLIRFEKNAISPSFNFHSNVKPYLNSEIADDTLLSFNPKNKFLKYCYLFGAQNSKEKNFAISLTPILTVLPGYEFPQSNTTLDTRLGGKLDLRFKNKLALDFQFFNINSVFTENWNSYAQGAKIIQGNGYAYASQLGYTNLQWNGILSYSPNNYFNFAAGRGKNSFGDGYRSLLLSDVANNYDFLKITTTIWKIKYVNLFTNFKDIRNSRGKNSKFENKYATFHYLSWNASKRINISFFESIIWQSRDTNNRNLGYDVNYLNPIIFYRPTEYSLGSSDNALVGASFKIKLFKKQQVYGQVLIDEFLLKEIKARSGWWANKQGFQLGAKSFDLFKISNLYFQCEWNYVRPYTYAHSNTFQNYGHFNESLAHPLGANFSEYFLGLNYQKNAFQVDVKITYAAVGLDSNGRNLGQNIYQSNITHAKEFGNTTGQGIKTEITTTQLTFSYLINKANNIRLDLGFIERNKRNSFSSQSSTAFFIGVRSALTNLYSDF